MATLRGLPDFLIAMTFHSPAHLATFAEGLRKAGLPE